MNQETVHLFVLDTMADWETGFAMAGINQPEYQVRPGRYEVKTVGVSRAPVKSLGGMTIIPDLALDEMGESAMLILCGGAAWDAGEHAAVADKAGELLAAGVPVAAICGATAGLARGGVLDGRRHTSNAREYLAAAPGYAGHPHYADEPAVRDGDLITASGVAPVDFARLIFERLEVYAPPVLDAWYALYAKGDPSGFYALAAEAQ